jgi:hypothetical protein
MCLTAHVLTTRHSSNWRNSCLFYKLFAQHEKAKKQLWFTFYPLNESSFMLLWLQKRRLPFTSINLKLLFNVQRYYRFNVGFNGRSNNGLIKSRKARQIRGSFTRNRYTLLVFFSDFSGGDLVDGQRLSLISYMYWKYEWLLRILGQVLCLVIWTGLGLAFTSLLSIFLECLTLNTVRLFDWWLTDWLIVSHKTRE